MVLLDKSRPAGGRSIWLLIVLAGAGGFLLGKSFGGESIQCARRMNMEALVPVPAEKCPICEKPECPVCQTTECPVCEKCSSCPTCEQSKCPTCPACVEPKCPACFEKKPAPEGCDVPRVAHRNYKSPKFDNPAGSLVTSWMDLKQFECPARKFGTDKVIDHSYEYMYTKYLGPIRDKPLRLLEIGLGCGMLHGTGGSLMNWIHYLPNSQISMLEYKADCAEEWRDKVEKTGGRMYIGSQEDPVLLAKVVNDSQVFGSYDVIVEDGVHDPLMQVKSLLGLWGSVKPGGIYVVEDVFRNYEPGFDAHPNTFMKLLHEIIDYVQCQSSWRNGFKMYSDAWAKKCGEAKGIFTEVLSVECQWEACLLVKRPVGVLHHD